MVLLVRLGLLGRRGRLKVRFMRDGEAEASRHFDLPRFNERCEHSGKIDESSTNQVRLGLLGRRGRLNVRFRQDGAA